MPNPEQPHDPRRLDALSGTNPEEIEGGFVRPLDDYFIEEKHRADTSRKLAYSLVWILGGTVFVHYGTVLILDLKGKSEAVQSLNQIFNVWLPVIASLVSAAVTYYFTRDKR